MKICCGVVIYNPELEEINNIIKKTNLFEKIYIFDNSDRENGHVSLEYDNIEMMSQNKNLGLSYAYHEICKKAKKSGYDYIMMFDQDSIISDRNINQMIELISDFDDRDKVGVFSPKIIYNNQKNDTVDKGKFFEEVDWCISSGSIINLTLYGNDICFDINYFIDRLDQDFCRQVKEKGYKVIRFNEIILKQQLGESIVIGKKVYSSHSVVRHYYMSRNRLYYNNKFSESNIKSVLQVIKHLYWILKFEPDKVLKMKAVIKGINDYKKDNFGKIKGTI